MTKKAAIQKIKALATTSFNAEQKAIAINMIEKAPDDKVDQWLSLILQRVKLGFRFDYAPEPDLSKIVLVEEEAKLAIIKPENQLTHKLIIGENYDGLKNLLITHRNAIDIIYIDPPYNTEAAGGEGNSDQFNQAGEYKRAQKVTIPTKGKFVYRDKFARTGWLNLLHERLKLARDLLTDNGVIFVSIDDNEQAYLKVLTDEIFGENNFVCNFIWEKIYSRKSNNKFVSNSHDYILCYRKSDQLQVFNRLKRTLENDLLYKYDDHDGKGKYRLDNLTIPNGKRYEIKINDQKYNPGKKYQGWLYKKEDMEKLIKKGRIYIPKKGTRLSLKRYLNEVKDLISSSLLFHKLVGHTDQNQKELRKILSEKKFDYPKGIKLLKYLIKLVPNNENATILDFFAGSGTTMHATIDLNREDNGKRKCILITNNENNIAYDVTYERLHRIIKREGTKGEKDFLWLNKQINYADNNLEVFKLKEYDVSFKQIGNLDALLKHAEEQLRKLNPRLNFDEKTLLSKLQYLYPVIKNK